MPLVNKTAAGSAMSPQLPLKIPSGRVHVYFVVPSKADRNGVERTTIYYTDTEGAKLKFMAKNPEVRKLLIQLGELGEKLSDVDEEFAWARGGALTISVIPKRQ